MQNPTGQPAASLTLVHTVPALVDTFDEMLASLAPDIPVHHVIEQELLQDALAAGELTPDIRGRVAAAILSQAEHGSEVVLCTCSTVGPGADDARDASPTPILRIDRPMARQAVQAGSRIVVAATVQTTIGPTMALLEETADALGREVTLTPVVFTAALVYLQAGDAPAYAREIADGLHKMADQADVIVLAQASMAPALALCGDIVPPILTSPRSGLEAAVGAYRKRAAERSGANPSRAD